jgi:hypothetical protein
MDFIVTQLGDAISHYWVMRKARAFRYGSGSNPGPSQQFFGRSGDIEERGKKIKQKRPWLTQTGDGWKVPIY